MKKEELLKQCRYYNGHESNNLFADYERIWINRILENPHHFDGYIEEYKFFGLGDFNLTDGVPISLKALLFNRFYHWSGGYGIDNDRDSFKDWYNRQYIEKSPTELIKHCRYYKGEEKNPFKDYRFPLWTLEKAWIEEVIKDDTSVSLINYCNEFKTACPDLANDNIIPMSLKAIIHNRYYHFGGSDKGFKDFLNRCYPQ